MSGFNNVVYEYFFKITILLSTYITCILKFKARHNCFCKIHCYNKTIKVILYTYELRLFVNTQKTACTRMTAYNFGISTPLVFQQVLYEVRKL